MHSITGLTVEQTGLLFKLLLWYILIPEVCLEVLERCVEIILRNMV